MPVDASNYPQFAALDRVRNLHEMVLHPELLREQLAESQRLATIGTIAAVIAHEFNNLLTPIVSYSQFALASANSSAVLAEPRLRERARAVGPRPPLGRCP